jgi:hypothetical protein
MIYTNPESMRPKLEKEKINLDKKGWESHQISKGVKIHHSALSFPSIIFLTQTILALTYPSFILHNKVTIYIYTHASLIT